VATGTFQSVYILSSTAANHTQIFHRPCLRLSKRMHR